MADADVRLTTVSKDGEKLGNLIPAGSFGKEDGKAALTGKWDTGVQISGTALTVDLKVTGSAVRSVQTPFGNQPFMAEIEESEQLFGMHVMLGGFPMKAWMQQVGSKPVIMFSNGGRWTKL